MASDPRLAALPALRKLAEEEARAYLAALYDIPPAVQFVHGTTPDAVLRRGVAAHLALLADMQRGSSRDAVARLVAEAVPNVQAWEVTAGCECGGGRLNMVRRACGMSELSRWEPDPVPAEALTLIALAVLS